MVLKDQLAVTGADAQFALPQANLMSTLTSGIMSGNLPWPMIIAGVVIALFLFLLNLPYNDYSYRILFTNINNKHNFSGSSNTCVYRKNK